MNGNKSLMRIAIISYGMTHISTVVCQYVTISTIIHISIIYKFLHRYIDVIYGFTK